MLSTLFKGIVSLCVIYVLLCYTLNAQNNTTDSLDKKQYFEISFGMTQMFISNSQLLNIRNQESIIVPTSSALFFVELRPEHKLKVPIFFNLPTETKQFLVNGQLINEKASPTFGTGIEFKLLNIDINEDTNVDFEIGPLASVIFDNKNSVRVAPLIASRIRLTRSKKFVMYIGGSYSYGINAFGLLYGTGTVF